MYTKEEKRNIRESFWLQFKTYSNKRKLRAGKSGKWLMENTGIKQLKLKFSFNEKYAWAGIEIDTNNLDKRIDLFDKLEKLQAILTKESTHELKWELEESISYEKTVSRIYADLKNVNIYNKDCWKQVNIFFYEVMFPIEEVYKEYFDFLKYQT